MDQRPAPWRARPAFATGFLGRRRSLGVAAALLLVSFAIGVWMSMEHGPRVTGPVSTTRGPAIQVVQPAGQVEQVERFAWSAPPLPGKFELQVRQDRTSIWNASSTDSFYVLPPELRQQLKSGVRYSWKVEAIGEDGRILAASAWSEFYLR